MSPEVALLGSNDQLELGLLIGVKQTECERTDNCHAYKARAPKGGFPKHLLTQFEISFGVRDELKPNPVTGEPHECSDIIFGSCC
jgi:hypothetical protein